MDYDTWATTPPDYPQTDGCLDCGAILRADEVDYCERCREERAFREHLAEPLDPDEVDAHGAPEAAALRWARRESERRPA